MVLSVLNIVTIIIIIISIFFSFFAILICLYLIKIINARSGALEKSVYTIIQAFTISTLFCYFDLLIACSRRQ